MLVFKENGDPFVCSGSFGSAVAAWLVSVAGGGGGGGGSVVVLDQKRNRKNAASMEEDDGIVNRLRL